MTSSYHTKLRIIFDCPRLYTQAVHCGVSRSSVLFDAITLHGHIFCSLYHMLWHCTFMPWRRLSASCLRLRVILLLSLVYWCCARYDHYGCFVFPLCLCLLLLWALSYHCVSFLLLFIVFYTYTGTRTYLDICISRSKPTPLSLCIYIYIHTRLLLSFALHDLGYHSDRWSSYTVRISYVHTYTHTHADIHAHSFPAIFILRRFLRGTLVTKMHIILSRSQHDIYLQKAWVAEASWGNAQRQWRQLWIRWRALCH